MIIEFETPYNKVSEKLVGYLRKEIMRLVHQVGHVARVEVTLKEDPVFIEAENKVCTIKITVFADNLVAHARSSTFHKAAKEAVLDLKHILKTQDKTTEELTTTIDV